MTSVLIRTARRAAQICGQRTHMSANFRLLPVVNSRFPSHNFASEASVPSNDVKTSEAVPDSLIKQLTIEVQGHDRAVIESYTKFMGMARDGFGLKHMQVVEKPKYIWRTTLLKSVHVHKKHRVQYETRNYYKTFVINYITGSTASTFLEYVQRNLPEGVAMKVTTETVEKFPEHLKMES